MNQIKRPSLVIDELKVRRNIQRMVSKADSNGIDFRPHFKTHHSKNVGDWYREAGVNKITVSSVTMAQYFVDQGWQDVTIAFPYNPLEWREINELSNKIRLNILVESKESLNHAIKHITGTAGYFIKLDVGTHRTGIELSQIDLLKALIDQSSTRIVFKGLLSHAGHTYRARGEDEIKQIYTESIGIIQEFLNAIDQEVYVSFGDTPSCSVIGEFDSFVRELRCGNFAYYDLMQAQIGSCSEEEIGVSVACPVVAKHPSRNEVVIYGGAVHFSKESLEDSGGKFFGKAVSYNGSTWEIIPEMRLTRISQEHGILHCPDNWVKKLQIGDIVGVLPIHSCLTAQLLRDQFTLEGAIIERMTI
jgi:D-serine deaminase-like pyridoxal phosphate-dependent protein